MIRENTATMNRFQSALSWLLLSTGLILTFLVWRYVLDDELDQANKRFTAEVQGSVQRISDRMESYEQALRGGVALLVAGDVVTQERWLNAVETLRVQENFPGMEGYGWSILIKPEEMRPGHLPHPPGSRDRYTAILYLAPMDEQNKNAIGYDMWSQEILREAMTRAMDSGEPTLSGKTTQVPEIQERMQAGAFLYLPVYSKEAPLQSVAQRRQAIIGFVYAPLHINHLMAGMLGASQPHLGWRLYDGDATNEHHLMYASDSLLTHESTGGVSFRITEHLEIAGRAWTLVFYAKPEFLNQTDLEKPRWVAIGGTVVSLVLFLLTWSLHRARREAERLARHIRSERQESQIRVHTILATVINGIITMGADRRIQTFNPAAEAMFGYRAEEVIGRNVNMLMPFPYAEAHDGYVAAHLQSGIAKIIGQGREVVGLRRNGERFPIWLEVGRADLEGTPLFVGSLQDITERKRAEGEIRKLSLAIEQSPSVVIITDPEGQILYVNPRFTEVTGYTREEVLGRNPRFLKSGHTNSEAYEELWRVILEGEVWRGELLNRKKDHAHYWAAVAMASIRDQQGETSGYVAVQEDVTLRKEAEHALIKAKEAAEEANRAKSDFLNTMSHELRTPLTVILGYLPLLRQAHIKLPSARKLIHALGTGAEAETLNSLLAMIGKMAGEMQRNGDHLLTLINDLLDISKIEAGKLTLNPTLIPAQPLVEGVVEALRVKAEEKGLRLLSDGSKLTVWADEVRFKQILLNLVGNAVKFTEKGEIRVETVIRGEMAEFAVIDTGAGIPPDELERVFERFHQIDNSTTRKAGGTGLGLAITRNLVWLSGGKIWVESTPGEGATFRFTLPMGDNAGTDHGTQSEG